MNQRCSQKALRLIKLSFTLALTVFLFAAPSYAQQSGGVRGQVTDSLGGLVVGATVTLVGKDAQEKTSTVGPDGTYSFEGVVPGLYSVRATANGFGAYESSPV